MKRPSLMLGLALLVASAAFCPPAAGQQAGEKDCAYLKSLHHTARGMSYWYEKENGGLERLTGVPYSQLGCGNCHAATCDACHRTEADGKVVYSTAVARDPAKCLSCHAREAAVMKSDKAQGFEDVHATAGLGCMDCHRASDVHGDGTEYVSMKQPGAVAPTCEGCHPTLSKTRAHTVHGGKLDCKGCHVRQVVSCTNCHFDTLVATGKRVAVPVSGWLFLMNANGKVTSANMQTFVVEGRKTFLMFAPQFSHSVMAKGRTCEECHATEAVAQAQSKHIRLLWLENGVVRQATGVVPVASGASYGLVFQNFADGKWSVIQDPAEPLIHYAGYGEPLTDEQIARLAQEQHGK